eukprot:1883969-Rhodomonas_salina.2
MAVRPGFGLISQHFELWKHAAGFAFPPPLSLHASSSSTRQLLLPPADADIPQAFSSIPNTDEAYDGTRTCTPVADRITFHAMATAFLSENAAQSRRFTRNARQTCANSPLLLPSVGGLHGLCTAHQCSLRYAREKGTVPFPSMLRICYAVSGTDIRDATTRRLLCAAAKRSMPGMLPYLPTRARTARGTDIAYGPTRRLLHFPADSTFSFAE